MVSKITNLYKRFTDNRLLIKDRAVLEELFKKEYDLTDFHTLKTDSDSYSFSIVTSLGDIYDYNIDQYADIKTFGFYGRHIDNHLEILRSKCAIEHVDFSIENEGNEQYLYDIYNVEMKYDFLILVFKSELQAMAYFIERRGDEKKRFTT